MAEPPPGDLGQATEPPEPPAGPPGFLRSMPGPLMALFLLLAAGGVALAVFLFLNPPFAPQPLAGRRPPPSGALTHDVLRLRRAPADPPAAFMPPCPLLAETRVVGGARAMRRITDALRPLCQLTRGVAAELSRALDGLRGTTIRFAAVFGRTGVESSTDVSTRTIWLNIKFARANTPTIHLSPVIVHEAWHLARGSAVTAREELAARRAELAACRELIPRQFWQRGCDEADELVALGDERALEALVAAGYSR